MKIQKETIFFLGILIISLAVAIIASAAQEGTILNIKAMERSESESYIQPTNEYEISKDISVIYVLKIQGGATGTYTVNQEQGLATVTYNMTSTVSEINTKKVNAIRQYAYDTWGFLMAKSNIIYHAYSKGS